MDQTEEKKLFLLDAFALIYRAYFAFSRNPQSNSKGVDTSAVFGFANTLIEVLRKEKPTHIAVVFDTPKPTFRHIEYVEYKAHREAMPEGISVALPYIHKLIEAFRIPTLFVDGYEADDVIGTLAKKAEKEGFVTYMMTPDKDYAQLITDKIFMYRPSRSGKGVEVWGPQEVYDKFDVVDVKQVIDYLGMMGDASDNIPGIPGVGDKTARKLLQAYGSMEGLYENVHELKGKMKEKVEANKEQAFLSRHLATICLDVPIELDAKSLEIEELDKEKMAPLLAELEFRVMAKKLLGEDYKMPVPAAAPASSEPDNGQMGLFDAPVDTPDVVVNLATIESQKHDYILVDSTESREALLKELLQQTSVCFDTETTGLDELTAEMVGMSFSFEAHKAYYVPVPEDQEEAREVIAFFRPLFESTTIEKIAQNIKYDMNMLKSYDVVLSGPLYDTMLAHYVLQPDMRHNMTVLSETYLNYSPVEIESLIGKKGKDQKSMRDLPPEEVVGYASEDADITWRLKEILAPKLEELPSHKVFTEIEMPLVPVLAAMEREGVRMDAGMLNELSKELENDILKIQTEIFEMAGVEFNIASPKQMGEVLFDHMKLDEKAKKTKTGQYSTSEATLSKMAKKHPIIEKILDFRSLQKLKSTYVDALPELLSEKTGRIHTSYNQAVAATGRLSSVNPNLQNIPIRTERGREVRKAFVARDEHHVLLAADYSQIELRLIAELSKDPVMVEAFRNKEDIHSTTAAKIFNVSPEEVTREMRSHAKTVNFGIIYGVSAFGLSEQTDMSRKEAKEVIDAYFATYTHLKEYMQGNVTFAQEHGYVETIMGRRRYLKDINSRNAVVRKHAERNAVNAPVQGSAADIIKIAMIRIDKALKDAGVKTKMLLQVHDELIFDVPKDEVDIVSPIIKREMEGAIESTVPLEVEIGLGDNWLQAH